MPDASSVDIAGLGDQQRRRKMRLRILAVLGIAAATVIASSWPRDSGVHVGLTWIGSILILVCIAGRTWCSFYIGQKKVRELVMTGPYSVTRNPLYAFSIIGAVGVGATFGSVVFAVLAGLVVYAVFLTMARREEAVLLNVHGDAFRRYCEAVPRFLPRLSQWQDSKSLTIGTSAVYVTFLDSLFFLAAFPFAAGIGQLQQTGWLIPLIFVP